MIFEKAINELEDKHKFSLLEEEINNQIALSGCFFSPESVKIAIKETLQKCSNAVEEVVKTFYGRTDMGVFLELTEELKEVELK